MSTDVDSSNSDQDGRNAKTKDSVSPAQPYQGAGYQWDNYDYRHVYRPPQQTPTLNQLLTNNAVRYDDWRGGGPPPFHYQVTLLFDVVFRPYYLSFFPSPFRRRMNENNNDTCIVGKKFRASSATVYDWMDAVERMQISPGIALNHLFSRREHDASWCIYLRDCRLTENSTLPKP